MKNLTYITGGARSGKSVLAENIVLNACLPKTMVQDVYYFATMQLSLDDKEQVERVERHRQRRSTNWHTVECPFYASSKIRELPKQTAFVIFDCLSLYVSNYILAKGDTNNLRLEFLAQQEAETTTVTSSAVFPYELKTERKEIENRTISSITELLDSIEYRQDIEFIIVSNEVGWGIVPENALARVFRDLLGTANQMVAEKAQNAFLTCSGLSIKLK